MDSAETTLYQAIGALSFDAVDPNEDGMATAARAAIYNYYNARTDREKQDALQDLHGVIDCAERAGRNRVVGPAKGFFAAVGGGGAASARDA